MAAQDPWYLKLLEGLGFNVTKLRWRWYQSQERAKRAGSVHKSPGALHWLRYPHKSCPSCGAINDREEKKCTKCGAGLPNMVMQRVSRAFGASGARDDSILFSRIALGCVLIVYAFQVAFGGLSFQSLMSPPWQGYMVLGALDYAHGVILGEYWRFLAFGLVHGGLLHIGMNAYVLVQLLPLVEAQVERGRLLVMLTLWQLGAGITCLVWYKGIQGIDPPVVGASGWLFGAMGYGMLYAHRAGMTDLRNNLLRWTLIMFALGFGINMMTSGGGISNAAHFGGLLAGFGTVLLPEPSLRAGSLSRTAWHTAFLVCLALWLYTFVSIGLSIANNADMLSDLMRG